MVALVAQQGACAALHASQMHCGGGDGSACEPSLCPSPSKASGASSNCCFLEHDRDCGPAQRLGRASSYANSEEEVRARQQGSAHHPPAIASRTYSANACVPDARACATANRA